MIQNWQQHYPEGVRPEINVETFDSITDVFDQACKAYADNPAFSNWIQKFGNTLTFRELDEKTEAFASFLQNHLKLKPGTRIAIQMPNLLQFPIAMFGAFRAGLIVVNTNPLYTAREMRHQFNDSGAEAVVIAANFASTLEQVIDETPIKYVIVTHLGDMFKFPQKQILNIALKYVKKMVPAYSIPHEYSFLEALKLGTRYSFKKVEGVKRSDTALLQYTGGTTGVSKGAILSHGNIIANMEQITEWIKPKLVKGEETVITALPMYHIFSLTLNCMTFCRYGAHNILITNPRDIPFFISVMKKVKFTCMSGVNTLFNALMNCPEFPEVDFSNLKVSVAGGMALQGAVAKRWKEMTGGAVIEGYGLTETSPVASCNPVDGTDKVGTIGLPLPNTEMKIIGEDGQDLGLNEEGEIAIKGPQVMQGYYNRPEETAKVMMDGGWFKSGDIAIQREDGFFKIVDRKKDMILVSGFNVYPNEIEDVVAEHEKVLEVAAVGLPDEKSGEVVKVFIVKKDPSLTEEEVIAFCKGNLTGYKVPKAVEFRDELPKTNVGKILRRELRDEAKKA
jgi:long-chain acyl-CoA synthetase